MDGKTKAKTVSLTDSSKATWLATVDQDPILTPLPFYMHRPILQPEMSRLCSPGIQLSKSLAMLILSMQFPYSLPSPNSY